MATGEDIRQILQLFQQETQGANLVAFIDVAASMTLANSSIHSQRQEYLDDLAKEAAILIRPDMAIFASNGTAIVTTRSAIETRLYLPSADKSEAIVICVDADTDVDKVKRKLTKLTAQVWPEEGAKA